MRLEQRAEARAQSRRRGVELGSPAVVPADQADQREPGVTRQIRQPAAVTERRVGSTVPVAGHCIRQGCARGRLVAVRIRDTGAGTDDRIEKDPVMDALRTLRNGRAMTHEYLVQ
jgi:hypothetical protein